MKQIIFFAGFIIFTVLASCSGPKVIAPAKVSQKAIAEKAAAEGNIAQAAEAWKQYFSEQPIAEITGSDFAQAAQIAFKTGDEILSVSWFDQARYKNFASAEMYSTLAKIFRSQKNISKELSALEFYTANFTENLNDINTRLFEIYFEIKMNDKALEIWNKMDFAAKNEISNLKTYFKINRDFENAVVCDSVSLVILQKEPENVNALEWNGEKYYWRGENRYQREMEKYNTNKTNKQYKILLTELDLATADFKKALPYFEKLWKIEPGEKYASYFANIYARFGDEDKVNYYKKFVK
jgi:tetratricopeptide (TPR) repeat protein